MKILIIEDEYNLADAISSMLKSKKYSVLIKTDGLEGLEEALTDIYDLIILDVMLPKMNGFEILKELREEKINAKILMLTSKNSTITTNKGDSFYVTNTTATINLENNKIVNNDTTGNFLRIQKDSWGNSGSNGGTVTLNLTNQNVVGDIVVDSISKLTMNLMNGSTFKGAINNGNQGEVTLTLDKTSTLTLTGNTYVKELTNADTTNSNINLNGYKLYINGVELTK